MSTEPARQICLRIQRFDPERDAREHFQEYTVPWVRGTTVLDCLLYVKEKLDSSLTFRASCRMGICGSCGVLINNFPHLACHTQVEELKADRLTVKPLPNLKIIKDLVVDLAPFFEAHRAIKPFIMQPGSEESGAPGKEFILTPDELNEILQFANCIKCGLCLSACPTCGSDRFFLGPQALAQCYRYCADNLDDGEQERFPVLNADHGLWHCHLAGACSEACPKGVDPALAIQLMKRRLASRALGLGKKRKRPD